MLLNAEKCQSYSFCYFWVIKGNPTEGEGGESKITTTQIKIQLTFCTLVA